MPRVVYCISADSKWPFGMSVNLFFIFNHERRQSNFAGGRLRSFVLMPTKRGKGSVGEGETDKKMNTTPDEGGKSVSEKSQVTRTSKNPFEKNP